MLHRTDHSKLAYRFRHDGMMGVVEWFFEKVFPVVLIGVFLIMIGMIVTVVVAGIMHGDNVCDTPMGARDLRCVGYYTPRHR